MNNSSEYAGALEAIYGSNRAVLRLKPPDLLEGWGSMVEQCEEGYLFDLSEYENDLTIRERIEFLLNQKELRRFPEFQMFADTVHLLDERFRSLFQSDIVMPFAKSTWWSRGVLRYAGVEYVNDMSSLYGIHVVRID